MDRLVPFSPRPQAGESSLALLRRAAQSNHHSSTTRFLYALDADFDQSITGIGALVRNSERWQGFCDAVGIDPVQRPVNEIRRVGRAKKDDLLWLGLRVGTADIDIRRSKVCVPCLTETGYGLAEWDHVAAVACDRHATLLQSSCASCETVWTPLDQPLACGCNPEAVAQLTQACSPEAAGLLHRIIVARDQAALDRLVRLWRLLKEWEGLGLTLSPVEKAEALLRLHSGHWPEPDVEGVDTGDRLHCRVALASLLEAPDPAIRDHAQRLLQQPMPRLRVAALSGLRWTKARAETVLGVGRAALKQLLDSGHLQASSDGEVEAASANALLWQLDPAADAPAQQQSLSSLRGGRRRATTGQLLSAALEGSVQMGGDIRNMGLAGLILSAPKPCPAISTSALTVTEAARRLGTNVESIKATIRLRLLTGELSVMEGVRAWRVDREGMAAFEREYVFASKLSMEIGKAPTTLASRLRHAGIEPVSGPGIDGGVSFLFRRSDLEGINLASVATIPYRSPAGRRPKWDPDHDVVDRVNARVAARQLGVSLRALREVVRERWLTPLSSTGPLAFRSYDVMAVAETLSNHVIDVEEAAAILGQSRQAFLRTWVISEFVQPSRFTGRLLMFMADLELIQLLWQDLATADVIGRALGRDRMLCPNLQKMGLIEPAQVIGKGARKVRLYRRAEAIYEKYRVSPQDSL